MTDHEHESDDGDNVAALGEWLYASFLEGPSAEEVVTGAELRRTGWIFIAGVVAWLAASIALGALLGALLGLWPGLAVVLAYVGVVVAALAIRGYAQNNFDELNRAWGAITAEHKMRRAANDRGRV